MALAPIESCDGGVEEFVESLPTWARSFASSASNAANRSALAAETLRRLGYANVGGLLMSSGIPYDSEAARAICGAYSTPTTADRRGPPRGVSHSRLDTAHQGREMGVLTLQNMAIHPSGATFESFAKEV